MKVKIPLLERDIGLGRLVGEATARVGVKPCGGCKKRAKTLDKMIKFTGKVDASR